MDTPSDAARVAAEERARALIDEQFRRAGWSVQDGAQKNLMASAGVAVREVTMRAGHGRVDYLLYVDRRPVGVIEAKPVGTTLAGVEWQSGMYADGLPDDALKRAVVVDGRLPFVFESTGSESYLTNGYDPNPRARRVFSIPRPEYFSHLMRDAEADPDAPTWRGKVRAMPPLQTEGLRPAQIDAVRGLERSLAEQRHDRSLIQMATGAGKTFTAITAAYRLLAHGGFRRILFLVDRNNLADQTLAEFENYRLPGDGRRFTEVYPVDKLRRAGMRDSANVVISTIQRVYAGLQGKEVPDSDDPMLDEFVPDRPVTVDYSADLPPESFDLVIVDEAHRSIYGVWRGVLEYFDAHVVGLTATPGKQTLGFFRQNLVSEYTYPQSVADGVNVDFDLYRIRTQISEEGSTIEAGTVVPVQDKSTRIERFETLDEDLDYTRTQLDRAVVSTNQIRLVLEVFRDRLFTEIFPGRTEVPKTLIFAKDDNHAESIVRTVREVFGRGNEFAAKITYSARDPKGQLQAFRNSPALRVAVTVDMIATGTDVKPLECVLFMRDVRSAQYFEQMKGRGARTIPDADFQAVTPDAATKTRFVIVDAVGVTEHDFVDPPLNRQKAVPLKKLLEKAASLTITEDEAATLASRLAKLELELSDSERQELDDVAGGSVRQMVKDLVAAVDADEQASVRAEAAARGEDEDRALEEHIERAVTPLAANPDLRMRILELRRAHDRVIDEVSADVLLDAYGVVDADKARSVVESWSAYLEEHRDEITAVQVMFEAGERRLQYAQVAELAERIKRPPYSWTPEILWKAYESLDAGRVRRSDHHTLTDLVSLLRFATGTDDELVPFADRVRENYAGWLLAQEQAGAQFSETQRWWLDRMVEVIGASAELTVDDLEGAPFTDRGGIDGAVRDLGPRAGLLIEELNEELTA